MHLVQLLLPLYARDGERLPPELFGQVRSELVERFGGLTAYSRSPAKGLWVDEAGAGPTVEHDDIVVYEVLVERLDRAWWSHYRGGLCERFRQKELLVRAQAVELL
jgi:hypothetical protein